MTLTTVLRNAQVCRTTRRAFSRLAAPQFGPIVDLDEDDLLD